MTLRLLGPDQSTALWDFTAPTGSGNPNTVICNVGAGLDFGRVEPSLLLQPEQYGATLLDHKHPPVEVVIPVIASASTDDNLWAGLGQLNRYVTEATRDHPLYLEWTELSSTYYYDIIGATSLLQLIEGDRPGALTALRKSTMGPRTLVLLRQPWRRGASVTTSSDTVEDDPATGTPDGSRTTLVTVSGDLPTPLKVRAQMDTGAAVSRLTIGHRWRGSRASTFFSDYLSDTGWFQCEATGRNWTITLGTDTAAATDGALASPATGNVVAQVSGAGGSVGTMTRRVRATRTTAMDSLRGAWVMSIRAKATGVSTWEIQPHWGPSTADPVIHSLGIKTHEIAAGTSTFGYIEPLAGDDGVPWRIDIPQTIALSGVAVEIWARRTSGTGNLNLDLVDLWPAEGLAQVVVGAGSTTTTLGKDLATPVTSPASGTAGTVSGNGLVLQEATDNAGVAPNTGTTRTAGRCRTTWRITKTTTPTGSATVVVRNVTDSLNTVSEIVDFNLGGVETQEITREWDAVAGKAYQEQVDDPDSAFFRVDQITTEFVPALSVNESIRTDPGPRYAVDKLDSSGNFVGPLTIEGDVPVIGRPGDNHIKLRADELPLAGYTENENKLDRDLTVTVTYDPRYAV